VFQICSVVRRGRATGQRGTGKMGSHDAEGKGRRPAGGVTAVTRGLRRRT
jgi:hypothetical protein